MTTPRFTLGQTVYTAGTHQTTAPLPCPDCLGTREWTVTTPAGDSLNVACLRCQSRSLYHSQQLPEITRPSFRPSTRALTIGQVTVVDPKPDHHTHAVTYMCNETGVGSGQNYYESSLYATEAEAMAEATNEAEVKTQQALATPGAQSALTLGRYKVGEAISLNRRASLFRAWYHGNELRQVLHDLIVDSTIYGEPAPETLEDIRERLRDTVSLDYHSRNLDEQHLATLLKVVEQEMADSDALCEAYQAFMNYVENPE